MYKSQKFNIESAEGKTSFEQSSQLLHSQIWDCCSGALKLKPERISIEGHHSQTQTDNQLRSISGQTVRDRAESVELFSLSKDQAEKMRYVEAKSDQYERSCACLKFNSILSRATSYKLCRLIAQLVVIRFWSNISLYLRLVLTKQKALFHFSLRNFLLLEKWPQLKRIFCQIFSIWVPESKPLHSSQVTCEPRSCSDSD